MILNLNYAWFTMIFGYRFKTFCHFMLNLPMVIQVDISGHPPFPNGSKKFSGHFGNLLFLAGFNFRGHFEVQMKVFLDIGSQ